MRNTRRFTAVFSLMILALSSVLFMPSQASACEEPPTPLLGLYSQSHLIVVGSLGAPGRWKEQPKDAEYSNHLNYERAFALKIDEVLKGDAPKNLAVTDTYYQYLGDEEEQAKNKREGVSMVPAADAETELSEMKGKRIFFLEKNDKGQFMLVYSGRDLSQTPESVKTYTARIKELNEMNRGGAPDKAKMLDWIVGLIENPLTRYDGAYELTQSFYMVNNPEEPQAAEQPAEGVEQGTDDHAEAYLPYGDKEYAAMLTAAQKDRIVKAFLSVQFNYEAKKYEDAPESESYYELLNEDDRHLLLVVGELHDRRVADRLLTELPRAARVDAYSATNLMDTLGVHFKDEKLRTLAQRYSDVAWGKDADVIEDNRSAYDGEMTDEEFAKLPAKTFAQRRAEVMTQFLGQIGSLTAKK